MPQVDIIHDDKVVASYPVNLGMLNGPVTAVDFWHVAQRCALDDGVLTEKQLSDATYNIRD